MFIYIYEQLNHSAVNQKLIQHCKSTILQQNIKNNFLIPLKKGYNKGLLPYIWGFPGSSDNKEYAYTAGDPASIPGWGRSPGEGHGNPLQYSCLENPHRQRSPAGYSPWGHTSQTQLKGFSVHTLTLIANLSHRLHLTRTTTRDAKRE